MAKILPRYNISTEVVEPLFGMQGYTGGSLVLFKAGPKGNTQHYFYSPQDISIRHLTTLNDTTAIAQVMQDKTYTGVATKEVEYQG